MTRMDGARAQKGEVNAIRSQETIGSLEMGAIWFDPARPCLPSPQFLIERFLKISWTIFPFIALSLILAVIATFRNFGFDQVDDVYPEVADGWGVWYWLAHIGLSYHAFFFIVNSALSAQIFVVAIPPSRKVFPVLASIVAILYMDLWYLFGQARWGMALALLSVSVVSNSVPVFLLSGLIAFFIHKGVAGGIVLLLCWRILRKWDWALPPAIALSLGMSIAVHSIPTQLLVLAGYGNYLNWDQLPSANTPVKFYYLLGVLFLWKLKEKSRPNDLIILTLLFLPLSFFNVFAGRAYVLYAVTLLAYIMRSSIPRYVVVPILLPFLADIGILLFNSGYFF
jgi:hypothetical protein